MCRVTFANMQYQYQADNDTLLRSQSTFITAVMKQKQNIIVLNNSINKSNSLFLSVN